MKKLEIVTRPEKLEEIKEVMNQAGSVGMTMTMVLGCGLQKGKKEVYRGTEVSINLLQKVKIEIVVPDNMVETLIEKIIPVTRTGNIGDGKIFISPVDDAVRIRTGERREKAV